MKIICGAAVGLCTAIVSFTAFWAYFLAITFLVENNHHQETSIHFVHVAGVIGLSAFFAIIIGVVAGAIVGDKIRY